MNPVDIRKETPIFRNLSRMPSDWSKHVVSLNASKTLSANPGTWEIQLVPFPNYDIDLVTKEQVEAAIYTVFKPMDIVHVGMRWFNPEDNKMESNIFMWGVVDAVYKSKVTMGNSVQRSIKITGRDATKLLIEDNVVFAPLMAQDADLIARMKALGISDARLQFLDYMRGFYAGDNSKNVFLDDSVVNALYWVLRNIPATNVALEANGKIKSIRDYMGADLVAFQEDIIMEPTLTQFSGSVMNYLKALVDEQFYEMWVDTVPVPEDDNGNGSALPKLIVRPKPFDFWWDNDSDGNPLPGQFKGTQLSGANADGTAQTSTVDLPFFNDIVSPTTQEGVTILDGEILQKDLGVSDYEVQTFFNMKASKDVIGASVFQALGYYMILMDVQGMIVYGVRPLFGESKMFWGSYKNLTDVTADAIKAVSDAVLLNTGISAWGIQDATEALSQKAGHIELDAYARRKRDMLWRWNRFNQIYESGSITFNGKPVSVGCLIDMPEEMAKGYVDENGKIAKHTGMTFYGVQWTQKYQFGQTPAWTTTMSLTRGHNKDDLVTYWNDRQFNKAVSLKTNDVMSIEKDVIAAGTK